MSWEMQVLVEGEWKSVRATGANEPYRFPDKGSGAYMLRICYPDQLREARLGADPVVCLKEVAEEPNMEGYGPWQPRNAPTDKKKRSK